MSESNTLVVDSISRTFGSVRALDNVSFTVRPGRLTGFVGANGAGKTTAMRIILGILTSPTGQVTFNGREVDLDTRRRFGYMPEERGLYPKMRIAEQLTFLGEVHGMPRASAKAQAEVLLESFGLGERKNDALQKLSLGNQQRVQIAAAVIHDPVMMILDEPFSGLDPLAVDRMAADMRERAERGVPVLFSSHQLDLVERLCDDVIIIDRGTIVAAGDAEALRIRHGGRKLRVRGDAPNLRTVLAAVPGVSIAEQQSGGTYILDLDPTADDQAVLHAALAAGPLREFDPVEATLAQIFREAVAP